MSRLYENAPLYLHGHFKVGVGGGRGVGVHVSNKVSPAVVS